MYARDARQQVNSAPAPVGYGQRGYPGYFGNKATAPAPPLTLQAARPIQHVPLMPGNPNTWTAGEPPGAWRAFYNDSNRTVFDAGYHDPNKGTSGRGYHQFSLGNYHPEV